MKVHPFADPNCASSSLFIQFSLSLSLLLALLNIACACAIEQFSLSLSLSFLFSVLAMKSKASLAPYSNSTASRDSQSATFQPASDQDAEEDLYYLEEENEIHADSENEARPLQDQIEKPFAKKELNNTSEIGKSNCLCRRLLFTLLFGRGKILLVSAAFCKVDHGCRSCYSCKDE